MSNSIEKFLGLTPEIIKRRKADLLKTLRTKPGTEYLKTRMKQFDVQPWPFISYLAHYVPDKLIDALNIYAGYDGAENREAILEGLREKYIMFKLIKDIEEKVEETDHYHDGEWALDGFKKQSLLLALSNL